MDGDYFLKLFDWFELGGKAIVCDFLDTYLIPNDLNPAKGCRRAPETSSTEEAIDAGLSWVAQIIQEATDEERIGFRGGIVSSTQVRALASQESGGRRASLNDLKEALTALGYYLPNFNHADREDYFSLDNETQRLVKKCRQLETKVYFILLLGYFRCKPIIFNFSFDEVESDTNYILDKHFDGLVLTNTDLALTTKTKLINRIFTYSAYSLFKTRKHKTLLLERLNDVAKISIESRYVFDECLAFFR